MAGVTSTYRLQLHAGFTFADAEAVAPYLAELGVGHLYLSPVLQAVPGSAHGYDVLDHTRVSEELGGEDGLVRLAETARQHGLGLVVDVVPNHMALVAPENSNAPLWDVLSHGREAEHAHWFDVDWDALDGRIGLPVLWEPLDEVLAKGDLRLGEENDGPGAALPRPRVPGRRRDVGRRPGRRRGRRARAAALRPRRLARARRGAQLPALLRRRRPDRGPGRAARRLRRHPPGARRPQPSRHRRGLPHRPPRRARRPRGVRRPAARRTAPGHRDLGGEDPRG